MAFHSGFAAIIGRPNVGKSTLLNYFTGLKVSIVSAKPQTTRTRVMGVMNRPDTQIVFVDTPGIHQPRTRLGEYMDKSISDALTDIDALLFVVDAAHITDKDFELAENYSSVKCTKYLVFNKIDLVNAENLLSAIERFRVLPYDDFFPVSAEKDKGLDALETALIKVMPEGPMYYPEDMPTDQPEQFICSELIREKALRHLRDEVPHGIGVEILRYEKQGNMRVIDATMYCEKASHKSIIIGKGGQTLREIGSEARRDLEKLTGEHIHLQIWVKVRPGWRDNMDDLKTLGYTAKQ